jgi:ATP-dependent DNA helicase RecG
MEWAIDAMRQSVPEPRSDGKVSPKVGAVLLKPDGSSDRAYRGELRDGDHAEYTLLERKNRDNKLDGSILFATLEPCAPGSRRAPKVSCAHRIVLARIKEVWIGIEDPDPTVDRKGIKYLQDCGVTVHMFDRDLQEIILEENKEFLEQALERAEEAGAPEKIVLSPLEEKLDVIRLADLSDDALQRYQDVVGIDADSLNRRLVAQNVLKREAEKVSPTGFGYLLFGRAPRAALPQAGLLATIYYPDGTEEPKDFDGPMVLIPKQVEEWLKDKLPNVIDRSSMQRQEVPALPFEIVREAIINALIHRNYEIRGAKCQLVITADTITIKSPGSPVAPITLEQLQAFEAPMLSRNPELHYVFSQMDLAEERGIGVRSMKQQAEGAELPLPRFSWNDPYLEVTLFRNREAGSLLLRHELLNSLNSSERQGWQWLTTRDVVTAAEYETALKVPRRTALNHLKRFDGFGLVRRVGKGRSTKYEVTKQ